MYIIKINNFEANSNLKIEQHFIKTVNLKYNSYKLTVSLINTKIDQINTCYKIENKHVYLIKNKIK